jgi:hypothetical protein
MVFWLHVVELDLTIVQILFPEKGICIVSEFLRHVVSREWLSLKREGGAYLVTEELKIQHEPKTDWYKIAKTIKSFISTIMGVIGMSLLISLHQNIDAQFETITPTYCSS